MQVEAFDKGGSGFRLPERDLTNLRKGDSELVTPQYLVKQALPKFGFCSEKKNDQIVSAAN